MAVEQAQQWLADPAGRHQFRLHSDGRPTEWVSDGESIAMDPLTPSGAGGEVGAGEASTVSTVQAGSTTWGSASNSQPSATLGATAAVRPAGWYRNASNPEEVRYWDGAQWAADRTVATPPTDDDAVDAPGRHSIRRNGSEAADPAVVGPSSVPPSGAHGNGAVAEPPPTLNPVAPATVSPPAPAAVALESAGSPASGAAPAIGADWYPDPSSRTRLRYWDGSGWTAHVLDELPAPRPAAGDRL